MSLGLLSDIGKEDSSEIDKETEETHRAELGDLMATARPRHSRRHSSSLVSEQERLARKRERNRIAQQVYRTWMTVRLLLLVRPLCFLADHLLFRPCPERAHPGAGGGRGQAIVIWWWALDAV